MRRLYEEWKSSGLSMKAFSLERNINPATFNYWSRRIRKERRQAPVDFLRLPITQGISDSAKAATIIFPSGARLDLYHPLDASFIKELVR